MILAGGEEKNFCAKKFGRILEVSEQICQNAEKAMITLKN